MYDGIRICRELCREKCVKNLHTPSVEACVYQESPVCRDLLVSVSIGNSVPRVELCVGVSVGSELCVRGSVGSELCVGESVGSELCRWECWE